MASQRARLVPVSSAATVITVTTAAAQGGKTTQAAAMATAERKSSMISRTGPGVGTITWFLSPGVEKTDTEPTRTMAAWS